MWKFMVLSGALLATGCARPSAGYSFHDLVWAASDGLREYEGWVASVPSDEQFPNTLCLAGIALNASLAETKTRSGDVGLPLASAATGLTGMLGYEFISTKSDTGAITTTLLAEYPEDPDAKGLTKEDGLEALKAWGKTHIDRLYKKWGIKGRQPGHVRPPDLTTGPTDTRSSEEMEEAFKSRTDLAAELWRIREALHSAVLNSPIRGGRGFTLAPGPLTLEVAYTLKEASGVGLSVQLAAQSGSGSLFSGRGVTEANKMTLVYVANDSPNQMKCSDKSIANDAFEEALDAAKAPVGSPVIPQPDSSG